MNAAGGRVGNVILEPSRDCAIASSVNIDSIRAGGTAQISFIGCAYKSSGDKFNVPVTINYDMQIAGMNLSKTEKGTIKGTAE